MQAWGEHTDDSSAGEEWRGGEVTVQLAAWVDERYLTHSRVETRRMVTFSAALTRLTGYPPKGVTNGM